MRIITLTALIVLLTAACAGDDQTGTPASSTSSSAPPAAVTEECRGEAYTVSYPADWHVDEATGCEWFRPDPFELPEASEATDIAIHVDHPIVTPFERIAGDITEGPDVAEVLLREEVTVSGRDAVRAETVSSGDALVPEGTRTYVYAVADVGGAVLVASTTTAAGGDYEEHKAVLDSMMTSLTVAAGTAVGDCSAAGLSPEPEPQPDLHGQVADVRNEIARLAVECDYAGLAALATADGSDFTASFGGVDDLAEFWADQEARGEEPMRFLRLLLDRPFGTTEDQPDRTLFVWPSAFVFAGWDAVPESDREALKPLYSEDDFATFEQAGDYLGHRVGIESDGNWLFFVAGD